MAMSLRPMSFQESSTTFDGLSDGLDCGFFLVLGVGGKGENRDGQHCCGEKWCFAHGVPPGMSGIGERNLSGKFLLCKHWFRHCEDKSQPQSQLESSSHTDNDELRLASKPLTAKIAKSPRRTLKKNALQKADGGEDLQSFDGGVGRQQDRVDDCGGDGGRRHHFFARGLRPEGVPDFGVCGSGQESDYANSFRAQFFAQVLVKPSAPCFEAM